MEPRGPVGGHDAPGGLDPHILLPQLSERSRTRIEGGITSGATITNITIHPIPYRLGDGQVIQIRSIDNGIAQEFTANGPTDLGETNISVISDTAVQDFPNGSYIEPAASYYSGGIYGGSGALHDDTTVTGFQNELLIKEVGSFTVQSGTDLIEPLRRCIR